MPCDAYAVSVESHSFSVLKQLQSLCIKLPFQGLRGNVIQCFSIVQMRIRKEGAVVRKWK
jgi:hypothetical protein